MASNGELSSKMDVIEPPKSDTTQSDTSCWSTKQIAICVALAVVLVVAIGLGVGLTRGLAAAPTPKPALQAGCIDWKPKTFSQDFLRKMTPGTKRWHEQDCLSMDQPDCPAGFSKPPFLLVSLDGFRAEYIHRGLTPTIKKMSECGVYTRAMRPVFPSKKFPSHYSIVTGLYPESHGIIANTMYDPDMDLLFKLGSKTTLDARWYAGEPIWNSVKKMGGRTATMFWAGSQVPIQDKYPDMCYNFNPRVPYDDRIKEVLAWLDMKEGERPDFMTLYLEEPDITGQSGGPYGKKKKVPTATLR